MLKRKKAVTGVLQFLLPCFLSGLFVGTTPSSASEISYTKYNIHVQGKTSRRGKSVYKASYANYIDPGEGHVIIPPNTPIRTGKWRQGFTIEIMDDSKLTHPIDGRVHFEFHARRMGMILEEYLNLITSPEPVSLKQFTKKDLEGIRDGKAYRGMTKNGVMAALGYPAAHKTPSPESNTWIYWRNRFRTRAVEFDADGKVAEVRD